MDNTKAHRWRVLHRPTGKVWYVMGWNLGAGSVLAHVRATKGHPAGELELTPVPKELEPTLPGQSP